MQIPSGPIHAVMTSRVMQNRLHTTHKMLPGIHPYELLINEGTRLPVSPQTIYVSLGDEK